ncbi:glycosyltransferase family 4 protein [Ruminococcus flavefaciens]|uniref:glycosyltransferase family 4 protein n=1 Tax=Ruminococcus flavefaciens TaxID=1265 RepID=UPI00048A7ADE|nr:glycosyltransferase family 1 protein [Ruminococcus flavefaciens]
MRIGIDGHMLGDHSGGNESYNTNILRNMKVDRRDRVFLFVRKDAEIEKCLEDKFTIVRFRSSSPFVRNFVELTLLCRKYRLDVLHTQYFIPFIRPCRTVVTIFDICFEHYRNIFTRKEYIRQKLLIHYAAKKADAIVTCSKYSAMDIGKCYGIDKRKITVAYAAADSCFRKLSSMELNEKELRERFAIGDSDYILSVGNLQPRKNLPRLIRAFSALKNKKLLRDEKLVIVGKKAWLYENIIREAGGENRDIIFTDYVETDDLVRLYNGASCFVYPSIYEGFGMPPLEAMACGTAAAVSDSSSLPEVAGRAGLYFDPYKVSEIGGAIMKLMKNEDIRRKCIDGGLERNRKFSWVDSATRIMKVYKKFEG